MDPKLSNGSTLYSYTQTPNTLHRGWCRHPRNLEFAVRSRRFRSSTENSAQALSHVKAQKFDLYLLDSWLPDLDGEVLCQRLREFDPTTPILFYSGAATEADKARAMAAGAQGYLVKPGELDQLTAEIRRLLLASVFLKQVAS